MADFPLKGPKSYPIPLWRGQDTCFTIYRRDPETGEHIDYDEDTVVKIVFTTGVVDYEFFAEIDGPRAKFVIDDQAVLDVRSNSIWRLQFVINGRDRAPIVGKVVRKDAK